jgi:hypothetical protein
MEFLCSLTGSPFGQAQNMIPDPSHQGSRQIHFSCNGINQDSVSPEVSPDSG